MRWIVSERPDGNVAIARPQRNGGNWHMTDEEIEQVGWDYEAKRSSKLRFVDPADVPSFETKEERVFRTTLRYDLSIDMVKARDIQKMRMREKRAGLMAALDAEFFRTMEELFADNPTIARVAAKKRALLNVTADPAIAGAKTLDQLKAVWPDVLAEKPD